MKSKSHHILSLWAAAVSTCAGGLAQTDHCVDAPLVTIGTYTGTTVGATNDGSASCGQGSGGPDVWFRYRADATCLLQVDTCDSSLDTVLSLHTECSGTTSNEIECNDESCVHASRVEVNLQPGNEVLIRLSGWNGTSGDYILRINCGVPATPGADAYVGELNDLRQFGREGDIVGLATNTPICNAGTEPLDWYISPDVRHPFIIFNLYRKDPTRLVQIGQSWAKHGFGSGQDNRCGFNCEPWGDQTRLGVGCSDTYDAALNSNRHFLGPRMEINPWTGAHVFEGSYLETHFNDAHDGIAHRLQVHDADLTPAVGVSGALVVEVAAVAHDDVNHLNSIAWEPGSVAGAAGGTWLFDIEDTATAIGPAIQSWTGATIRVIPPQPTNDGRCYLAYSVTQNPNGTWHFEYALQNLDMDRGVQSFKLAIAQNVIVSNLGFHAVESHGEGISNAPWAAARDATGLTWATQTYAQNPFASALRWGTLYNFWFDANQPPAAGLATLGLFKPGTPLSLAATGISMPGAPCTGDVDGDRVVGIQDLTTLLARFGQSQPGIVGDLNYDAVVDIADLSILLAAFGMIC